MTIHEVIKRPIVTEKGVAKKDSESTLCFEVAAGANKTLVKAAVEQLFKVKVADVRTINNVGKLPATREIFRLPFGLEEGVRAVEAGAEGSRVRGDIRIPHRERKRAERVALES